MCSNALEFDKDILRNVVRDQRRIAEAYARAIAYIDLHYPLEEYDLKLRNYQETKIAEDVVERTAIFHVYVKGTDDMYGGISMTF